LISWLATEPAARPLIRPIGHSFDEQHLTPRERLELFVPVCQAIQHAHQKGIIHRDIARKASPGAETVLGWQTKSGPLFWIQ
jgi:serine/threonine protein kinase